MSSNPKVSVILPIYGVEEFIGECVDSLVAQTFSDFEVVCVDDGSPDRSVEVAREHIGDDARFRFFAQENAGLSAARNHGLREARGDYLLFLDSDDLLVPQALELLYLTACADDLDYLDFTAHTFYESKCMKRVLNEDYFEQRTSIDGVMTGPELFTRYQQLDEYCCPACFHFFARALVAGNAGNLGTTGASGPRGAAGLRGAAHASRLTNAGIASDGRLEFVEGIIHEDELFSPLLIANAKRAAFLNEPLYLRRMRDESIMNTRRGLRNVEGVLYVARALEDWLRDYAQGTNADRAFVRALSERIAMLHWIAVTDAQFASESELIAHESALQGDDLVDFELVVHGGAYAREKTRVELDWRRLRKVAHTVLDGPLALADTLSDKFRAEK